MDVGNLNRAAWDAAVEEGSNPYTKVVSSEVVAAARAGSWSILLTDTLDTAKSRCLRCESRSPR